MAPNRSRERQVDAAEEVALAGPAALEREQVAARDVAHVDDVHARVDVAAVAAGRDALDHPPGRRREAVALADRRGRVDDDGVEPVACRGEHDPLGLELRALVRDGQLPVGRRVLLRCRAAGHRPARPAGRRVDEPAHAELAAERRRPRACPRRSPARARRPARRTSRALPGGRRPRNPRSRRAAAPGRGGRSIRRRPRARPRAARARRVRR